MIDSPEWAELFPDLADVRMRCKPCRGVEAEPGAGSVADDSPEGDVTRALFDLAEAAGRLADTIDRQSEGRPS